MPQGDRSDRTPIPPRKASKHQLQDRPYRKPSLVGSGKYREVDERSSVKELGKLTPYLRKKGCPVRVKRTRVELEGVAGSRLKRLFTKNTGLCEGASRRIGADSCPVPEC